MFGFLKRFRKDKRAQKHYGGFRVEHYPVARGKMPTVEDRASNFAYIGSEGGISRRYECPLPVIESVETSEVHKVSFGGFGGGESGGGGASGSWDSGSSGSSYDSGSSYSSSDSGSCGGCD